MKNLNPLEKDIEAKVVAFAKSLGMLCYKFTSPSRRSVPDRIAVLPGGKVIWIEFKRIGQKPTPAQSVEIEKLRKQGATVYVVDNADEGKNILKKELEKNNLDNY